MTTTGGAAETTITAASRVATAGVGDIDADEGAAASYRPRYNVAPAQRHPILRTVGGPARLESYSGAFQQMVCSTRPSAAATAATMSIVATSMAKTSFAAQVGA